MKNTTLLALLLAAFVFTANAQTTAFTYQGRLTDTANPGGSATYDMQFRLWDNPNAGQGTQQGGALTIPAVQTSNNTFTAQLDFGSGVFAAGANLYLETSIRPAGSQGGYTALAPRQRITGVPYATRALSAATADNLSGSLSGDVTGTQTATVVGAVGGKTAAQVSTSVDETTNATNLNTPNTIVRRDSVGGFSAGVATVTNSRLSVAAAGADSGEALRVTTIDPNPSTSLSGSLVKFRSSSAGSSGLTTDRFRFDNAGGFVALGTLGYGIIPASGAGERMMWHPYKGAFRAGEIGSAGTQWDDANVGFYSWAGGYNTTAFGTGSFAMGYQSSALGSYSNALGYTSVADGTGAVAIGYRALAQADYSVAIGNRATNCDTVTGFANAPVCNAPHSGAISIADGSTTTSFLTASANNQFNVRAAGGYRLFSNTALTTGVSISAGGGSWTQLSDRNAKENFGAVNSRDVLRKVLNLPISTWSYKGQTYRHIGAMAQDFYAAFKVGENDKTITTVDPDGVALAAIQGLNEELRDELKTRDRAFARQQEQINRQQQQADEQEKTIERQRREIDELKQVVCSLKPDAAVCKGTKIE